MYINIPAGVSYTNETVTVSDYLNDRASRISSVSVVSTHLYVNMVTLLHKNGYSTSFDGTNLYRVSYTLA
jgi:hypothetical protein